MIEQQNSSVIQFISYENIGFDFINPRLPNSLKKAESDIIDWMLSKENITDLMSSIGEKGFFPGEPLLVVPNGKKYIVIEGNRRYTAVLLLNKPDLATQKKGSVTEIVKNANQIPKELPCLIFNAREEIIDYLGYRHITGVEAWDSLAKARYLRQLSVPLSREPFKNLCKILARQIGSTPNYVKQLLLGIELYDIIEKNNFFDITNLDDRNFDFGTFYTGIVKQNISKFINIDFDKDNPISEINIDNLGEITRWFFQKNDEGVTRIGESRNLGKLDKVLDEKYSAALDAFRSGYSLSFATEMTDESDNIVADCLRKSNEYIEMSWKHFPLIKDYSSFKKDDIKRMSQYLKRMYDMLEERQAQKTDDTFL